MGRGKREVTPGHPLFSLPLTDGNDVVRNLNSPRSSKGFWAFEEYTGKAHQNHESR